MENLSKAERQFYTKTAACSNVFCCNFSEGGFDLG